MAVIGGGIFGLSAALALAEAGRRVVVLEAGPIGAGASGRNGGLVVPSLPRIGPGDVTRELAMLVAGSAAAVFALIRRLHLDCDARQSGWLMPAHAAVLAPRVRARVAAWQQAGAVCEWLDVAETRARLGSERFHGALFDRTGGHLDPLAYTRGLAGAAMAAGATVHTGTAVRALRGNRLNTATGTVTADRILQCTNGRAEPGPGGLTVPLTVYQMATPPLPEAVRAAVLSGDEAFSDTRNNLLACRWTAGGRLVTGGLASIDAGAYGRLARVLAARLGEVFPALRGVRFERIWRGPASLTGDFRPRLFQPAPDWLVPVACNGRGIALSTVLGQAIGRALATGHAMPLPVVPPRAIRPNVLASLVPRLLLPLGTWQDRRAERTTGGSSRPG